MSSLCRRSTSTSICVICVYLELHPIFIPDTFVSILYSLVVVSAVVALASTSMETLYRHLRESWLIPAVVLEEPRRVLEDPWWHPGDPWRSLGRYLEVRVWSPILPLTNGASSCTWGYIALRKNLWSLPQLNYTKPARFTFTFPSWRLLTLCLVCPGPAVPSPDMSAYDFMMI